MDATHPPADVTDTTGGTNDASAAPPSGLLAPTVESQSDEVTGELGADERLERPAGNAQHMTEVDDRQTGPPPVSRHSRAIA